MNSLVLLAAGSGSRLNLGYNKMFFEVNNMTILEITLCKFVKSGLFKDIIIVCKEEEIPLWKEKIGSFDVKYVVGGENRQDSVFNGVSAASYDTVWVHDGARCNITGDVITKLAANYNTPGVVCAVKTKDSLRIVKDGIINSTLDRDTVYQMQTPQIVNKEIYVTCYNKAIKDNILETDEVGLLFNYGYNMHVVDGDYGNIKVTTKEDLGAIDERI